MAALRLEHLQGNTWYIPAPTNIGVYVSEADSGAHVVLIDSGNDKEAGRQILKILKEKGWDLDLIVHTHSNADHIGGNAFIQKRTNCKIAATETERAFITHPQLEPAFLYGGYPHPGIQNKFLMAEPSMVTNIIEPYGQILDTPLTAVPLPGHFFNMIGILTPDNVFFIADSLMPAHIIDKYHIFFLYDIEAHLKTLEMLENFTADGPTPPLIFLPSHGKPTPDIGPFVSKNQEKIEEICGVILDCCPDTDEAGAGTLGTEDIISGVAKHYGIEFDENQWVLVSGAIKSYLAYLSGLEKLKYGFLNGKMVWKTKKNID